MVNLARDGGVPVSFETDRFYIRRYVLADARNLCEAAQESIDNVYRFLPWCHPEYTIEDSRSWIRAVEPDWRAGTGFSFAIYDSPAHGRLLGGCGLSRLDEHPVMNLGYWVRTSELGRGIAAEATLGLADYAFRYLDVARLEIIMSTQNGASRRVAEKAGAAFEGTLKHRLRIHGTLHDAWMYSLTKSEDSTLTNPGKERETQ